MARRRHDVDIGINAKDNASRNVSKVEKSFSKLGGLLAGVFAAATAAAAAGLLAISRALESGIANQSAYEKGLAGLSSAFGRAGVDGDAAAGAFASVADELERSTNIAAEVSIDIGKLGLAFGVAAQDVGAFTQATLDFAAGADLSATEAARRLGRAMQGSAGDVANFNVEIRKLTKEQLAAGEATRLIAETFQGAAGDAVKNYAGSVERLNNAYENLAKTLAKNVTGNANVITGNQQLAESVDQVNKNLGSQNSFISKAIGWWNSAKANLKVLVGVNAEFITGLGAANDAVKGATEVQEDYNDELTRTIRIQDEEKALLLELEKAASKLGITLESQVKKEQEEINEALDVFERAARSGVGSWEDLERATNAASEANKEAIESIDGEAESLDRAVISLDGYRNATQAATEQTRSFRQEQEAATQTSGQFAQNLLGGQSEFSQLSGGTFSVPQPRVSVNDRGRVVTS